MPARSDRPPANQALVDALLEFGRSETPADLAARGVRRVRSVSLARVSRMIEQAINQTVMERTLGVGSTETGLVLDAARERFQELLRAGRALGSSRADLGQELADLEEQLSVLRERAPGEVDVAERRRERQDEYARQDELIAAAIGEILGALHAKLSPEALRELGGTKDKIVEVCLAMVREERRRALMAEAEAHDRHVELLERRIAKLVDSLRRAEAALAQVEALKHVDQGIESIYRTVQGLSVDDQDAERKRTLLADIFAANVELRAQCAAAAAAPAAPSDAAARREGCSPAAQRRVGDPAS